MDDYQLIDNKAQKQFEFHIEEHVPRIDYIRTTDKIFLTHTEVPVSLEGRGIASQLIRKTLEEIKKSQLTLVPLCPFVAMYIKKHPEWRNLVLRGINIE